MSKCLYDKVIVIGAGKIVGDVIGDLVEEMDELGYSVEYIKYEPNMMPLPKRLAEKITTYDMPEKNEVTDYLKSQSEKVFVVSAGNNYIFPKSVVSMSNIFIINFHNALLPNYRGRNAPTWAIYYGEKISGPTWHIVTSGVDEGGILFQKECPINDDMKAYELARDIMLASHEGFSSIFKKLLTGEYVETKLQSVNEGKMYYSYDVPNGGRFEMTDSPKDIYRLLRATDYGLTRFLPYMKTELPGIGEVEIVSYKKRNADKLPAEKPDNSVWIKLDRENVLELKYKQ